MIVRTWKTRKNESTDSVEFNLPFPSTMDETDLIEARYGSVERMMDRAASQSIVDIAPGIRKRLPDADTARSYVEKWCNNGTKDSYVPSISAAEAKKDVKFTDEQLAWIAAHGMKVGD